MKRGCWSCAFDVLREGLFLLHSWALVPLTPQSFGARNASRDNNNNNIVTHLVNVVLSCQRLNSAIIYDRDFSYNYFGFKVKGTVLLALLGRLGMLVESSGLEHRRRWDIKGEDKGDLHKAAAHRDKSWSFLAAGIFYPLGWFHSKITLSVVGGHS